MRILYDTVAMMCEDVDHRFHRGPYTYLYHYFTCNRYSDCFGNYPLGKLSDEYARQFEVYDNMYGRHPLSILILHHMYENWFMEEKYLLP
jgi:hypothetical protein